MHICRFIYIRSVFNQDSSFCEWSDGKCKYSKPQIDLNTIMVIAMLVLAISTPLLLVLGYIFNHVIFGPSPQDVFQKSTEAKRRLTKVSMIMANTRRSPVAQAPAETFTGVSPEIHRESLSPNANDSPVDTKIRRISSIQDLFPTTFEVVVRIEKYHQRAIKA